jgi:hypothetical protein
MDREEPQAAGGTINSLSRPGGIDVSIYLTPAAWQELVENGSTQVSRPYDAAPDDARIVKVSLHRPR